MIAFGWAGLCGCVCLWICWKFVSSQLLPFATVSKIGHFRSLHLLTQLYKWVPGYRQWWKCEWFSLGELCLATNAVPDINRSVREGKHYNESVHRKKQHTRGNNTIPYKLATLLTFKALKWNILSRPMCSLLPVTNHHWSIVRRTLRNIVISGHFIWGQPRYDASKGDLKKPTIIVCIIVTQRDNSCSEGIFSI